jgi:hypothetical protein
MKFHLIPILLQASLALSGILNAQGSVTLSPSAHMDAYQAGGYSDGGDGAPPVAYTFPAAPGRRSPTQLSQGRGHVLSGNYKKGNGLTTHTQS